MNILILTTHLNPGGVSRYVINLSKGLKGLGHTVWVCACGGNWITQLDREIEFKRVDINTKSVLSPKVFKTYRELCRFVKQEKIDVVHANSRVTQMVAFLFYKLKGVAYVSTFHGFYKPHFFRKIFKLEGAQTIAVSKSVKFHCVNDFNISENDVHVVYNGIDKEMFLKKTPSKEDFGFSNQDIVLGILGRISAEKGHRLAVDAFKLLSRKYNNLYLLISGEGKMKKEIKLHVNNLKLADRIKFVNVEAAKFLDSIDILLIPSSKEGFGYIILEAFVKEVAAVGFAVGGIKEIIEDKENGFLFYEYSSSALSEVVEKLIIDKDLRKRVSSSALKYLDKFSLESMAKATEAVYRKAL